MMNTKNRSSFLERLLLAAALVLLAGALALVVTMRTEVRSLQSKTRLMEAEIEKATTNAEAALSAVISPETLRDAQSSVYLIVVNGAARGTAFVIDRENGLLATAAHVADALPLEDDAASVFLLNRATGRRITVVDKKLHAGFGVFRDIIEDYQPIRKNASIYTPPAAALRDLAFDAGLLRVDPVDPGAGETILGPNLPIASEDRLLRLAPGEPIAVIGYPYDTLDDGIMADVATPRVERGVIAAVTPPLDHAGAPRDPAIANLIIHRLSTAGGSSGSPIVDAAGDVVGIHTHGIESKSSNADGAAQRAEVIYDLLSEERETARLETVFLPAWKTLLTHWARAADALSWSFYYEYAKPGLSPAPLVADVLSGGEAPFEQEIRTLTFEESADQRRVAIDDRIGADSNADKIEKTDGDFVIREAGQFAEFTFKTDRSDDTVLFAFDYSLRSKRGFCPLTGYWRRKGDGRLRVQRNRASFELFLPANGEGMEDYQIILRRDPKCDPISTEFIAGRIAWPRDKESMLAAAAGAATFKSDGDKLRLSGVSAWLTHAYECRLGLGLEENDACAEPEYVTPESD